MIAVLVDMVVSILVLLASCLVFLRISQKVKNGKTVKQYEEKSTEHSFENYFYDIENKAIINTLKEVEDDYMLEFEATKYLPIQRLGRRLLVRSGRKSCDHCGGNCIDCC